MLGNLLFFLLLSSSRESRVGWIVSFVLAAEERGEGAFKVGVGGMVRTSCTSTTNIEQNSRNAKVIVQEDLSILKKPVSEPTISPKNKT